MRSDDRDRGFVLPYVLLTLTVLSIVMSMVVIRMTSVSNSMRLFVQDADASRSLSDVETEAIYLLLTSVPVDEGLAINAYSFGGDSERGLSPGSDVTSNEGLISGAGTRIILGRVSGAAAEFQDLSGLIPLNSQNARLMSAYLRTRDVGPNEALSLSAKWIDYTDEDTRRIFRGAERADYRIKNLTPPSNRPIRRHSEMMDILDWRGLLQGEDMWSFIDETSVNDKITHFNSAFADPALVGRFKQSTPRSVFNRVVLARDELAIGERTTNGWRVTLSVPLAGGGKKIRVLDVERTLSALNEPHDTNLIYERTLRFEDMSDDE